MRGAFLFFDVDYETELKFHGELVPEYCDLSVQVLDQCFVKLCDAGFLSCDEVAAS